MGKILLKLSVERTLQKVVHGLTRMIFYEILESSKLG